MAATSMATPATAPLRTLLFRTSSPRAVTSEMERLEALFSRAHKQRKPEVDLFFSDWGTPKSPEYGITLYYTREQFEEAAWFCRHCLPST